MKSPSNVEPFWESVDSENQNSSMDGFLQRNYEDFNKMNLQYEQYSWTGICSKIDLLHESMFFTKIRNSLATTEA